MNKMNKINKINRINKKYLILFISLIALMTIGILSGKVYSLGHFKDQGGPGGSVVDCNICHDFANGIYGGGGVYGEPPPPLPPSGYNLRWVKTTINSATVKFTIFSGTDGSLADAGSPNDGACQVCHTTTTHWKSDGSGKDHYAGQNCTLCHPHFLDDINNYFEPRFVGNQSHFTHFDDPKGPLFKVQRPTDYCTYYCHSATDFSKFKDGLPLATTAVCNPCHSKGGTNGFDGVDDPAIGAKPNWTDAIYEAAVPPAPWPSALKAGKENWCAGCHDNGTSVINSVSAPNVMGDNVSYGYNVSGHGRNSENYIGCVDCHDLSVLHTDSDARTYSAALNNYRSGYRLNEDMAIPRINYEYGPNAYKLCLKCHIFTEVMGPASDFRNDNTGEYLHNEHLNEIFRGILCWDSDWNGVCAPGTGNCDSAMSCTACHNVHGSPCLLGNNTVVACPDPPKVPMIRHGELISPPGTTSYVPALRFNWYDSNNNPTTNFTTSRWGGLLVGQPQDVTYNHVCWGCHTRGEVKYYRVPGGAEVVTVHNVQTSDWSNNPKTIFAPGDQIRYHVNFTMNGPNPTYFVKAIGTAVNVTCPTWKQTFQKTDNLAKGTYDWYGDKTIPVFTPGPSGCDCQVTIVVGMFESAGGILIYSDKKTVYFHIQQ